MAKKQIQTQDLVAKDLLNEPKKQADLLLGSIDQLLERFKELSKVQLKNLKGANLADAKGVKNVSESIGKTTTILREYDKLQTQRINTQKKLTVSDTLRNKELQKTRIALQEQNKIVKQNVIINREKEGSLKRLRAELSLATSAYDKLSAEEREFGAEGKKLKGTIDSLQVSLKKAEGATGRFQRNVGNYPQGLSGAITSLKSFASALGIVGGVTALAQAVKGAFNIFKDFEAANSTLSAILGATEAQMASLEEQSKSLGATTAFTASEVVALQTEFAKLGFPTEDILKVTESTLNAASAMGSGLAEQAALTGSTLKAFKLDASEAARVNDVLAASTTNSALDFNKLNASLSTISPVAKKFGFSLEDSVSLLGELSNAGFDASTAATATRNILLNLADSNGALAKSIGGPVKDLPSLIKGLDKLKNSGIDLGEALELTDVRSVAAFSTFLEGTENIQSLSDKLVEAGQSGGEFSKTLASIKLDNLSGDLTILNSAWEGFILSLESGNGAFATSIRNLVKLATEILSLLSGLEGTEGKINKLANTIVTIGKVVVIATSAFVAYKTQLIASRLITVGLDLASKAYAVTKGILTGKINLATIAQKLFNAATKANPIGILITVLTAAATAFFLFRDGANEATEAQKSLNDEIEKTNKALKSIESIDSQIKSVKTLNEAQLGALKERIDSELSIQEEFNKKALQAEIDNQKEINKVKSSFASRRAFLESRIAKNANDRLAIDGLKRLEIDEANAIKFATRGQVQVTSIESQENQKRLSDYKKTVEEQLELVKGATKEVKKDSDENPVKVKFETDLDGLNKLIEETLESVRQEIRDLEPLEIPVSFVPPESPEEEVNQFEVDALDKIVDTALEKEKERVIALEEEKRQAVQQTTEFIQKELQRRGEAQEKLIDKEISRRQKAVDVQAKLAERGLDNTLEYQEEELAKAELRKIELERDQVRREKVIAYYKILQSAVLDGNPNTAPLRALSTIATAEAIAQGLTAYDGVEDTGAAGNADGRGGKLWVLHPHEGVVNRKANEKHEGAVGAMNKGYFDDWVMDNYLNSRTMQPYVDLTQRKTEVNNQNSILANEIRKVKDAIKGIKQTEIKMDTVGNYIETIKHDSFVRTINHFKKKPRL